MRNLDWIITYETRGHRSLLKATIIKREYLTETKPNLIKSRSRGSIQNERCASCSWNKQSITVREGILKVLGPSMYETLRKALHKLFNYILQEYPWWDWLRVKSVLRIFPSWNSFCQPKISILSLKLS